VAATRLRPRVETYLSERTESSSAVAGLDRGRVYGDGDACFATRRGSWARRSRRSIRVAVRGRSAIQGPVLGVESTSSRRYVTGSSRGRPTGRGHHVSGLQVGKCSRSRRCSTWWCGNCGVAPQSQQRS
jgi:hypothetical protein